MSSIFKDNQSGKWMTQIQIGYYGNGRPKYKRIKGDTKKDVIAKLKEYELKPYNPTVYEYINDYITVFKTNKLKPSSLTRDYGILNNQIKNTIGDYNLTDLTAYIIQSKLINELVSQGYSHSTIHKAYTLLNECLNYAVNDTKISYNPCKTLSMPSKSVIKPKEIEILSDDEIQRFIQAVNTNKYSNSKAIMLILYTGLRVGELCALKWSDIDFTNNQIIVQRNISVSNLHGKREVCLQDGTKTRLKRIIPLNEQSANLLHTIKSECEPYYEFVIQTKSKVPDTHIISNTYNKIIKYADIQGKTGIHTLRHTFASVLLNKGVDIKIVSEILGHSSVSFTYDTYVHILPNKMSDVISNVYYNLY